jgi:hypothetical protein
MQKVVVLAGVIETTNRHHLPNLSSRGDTFFPVDEDHEPDSGRDSFADHAIVTT